jgi:hypothetical protein
VIPKVHTVRRRGGEGLGPTQVNADAALLDVRQVVKYTQPLTKAQLKAGRSWISNLTEKLDQQLNITEEVKILPFVTSACGLLCQSKKLSFAVSSLGFSWEWVKTGNRRKKF